MSEPNRMSLLEAAEAIPTTRPTYRGCGVGRIMKGLADDERVILQGWLDDTRDMSHVTIAKRLKFAGLHAHESTVQRHRSGQCSCEK
jgi:hypothetical protein